ncbi:uncharacterized protein LOC116027082 [Ipomoea triloba]|uniref:uncharacterized protein LOC116027082 n=1 Tax=Ipomoea triloba TaxID=35885 RepID=UPI00125D2ECE|nr:uncharacterized protein LOC116027082 [Ipomoea triloba]
MASLSECEMAGSGRVAAVRPRSPAVAPTRATVGASTVEATETGHTGAVRPRPEPAPTRVAADAADVNSRARGSAVGARQHTWVPRRNVQVEQGPLNPPIPFNNLQELEGDECNLLDLEKTDGIIDLGVDDVLVLEDVWSFRLLGRFAGRFPGMRAVDGLVKSWSLNCKAENLLNGHVLFWFLKEEDRQFVLDGGPYALFGKRLLLHIPPEGARLAYEDYCKMPVWIRMPWLPKPCWHLNALSKIAANLGKPLMRDRFTKEMKKSTFARILVEVDCSTEQPDHVSIKLPGGDVFEQPIVYENLPMFCSRCGSGKHVTKECPLSRVENNLRQRAEENNGAGEAPRDNVNVDSPMNAGEEEVATNNVVGETEQLPDKETPTTVDGLNEGLNKPVNADLNDNPPTDELERVGADASEHANSTAEQNGEQAAFGTMAEAAEMERGSESTFVDPNEPGYGDSSLMEPFPHLVAANAAEVWDFIKNNQLSVCCLLETKLTLEKANRFVLNRRGNWKFSTNFHDVDGGRMIVVWDFARVDCLILETAPQFIHCLLVCKISQVKVLCTFVYGLYSVVTRRPLWNGLQRLGSAISEPWLVVGDFNATLAASERRGGADLSRYDVRDFEACCMNLDLTDCPSFGRDFTWTNGHMEAKLDRVLINDGWLQNGITCMAIFGRMEWCSDHSPVIVTTSMAENTGKKPFKFLNMWLKHPEFDTTLNGPWAEVMDGSKQLILSKKLKALKGPLRKLNRQNFSHISERVKSAKDVLAEAQENFDVINAGEDERTTLRALKAKAVFLLEAERQFFAQKLNTTHLVEADKGSKYFHELINKRNAATSISAILDSNGALTHSLDQVGRLFVDFFSGLFGRVRERERTVELYFEQGEHITANQAAGLAASISAQEIREALFSMGNDKSPGSDGYTAAFFKSKWSTVGVLVTEAVREFFRNGQLLKQWNHT